MYPFVAVLLTDWLEQYIEKSEHKKHVEISIYIFNGLLVLGSIVAPIVFLFLKDVGKILLYACFPAVFVLAFFVGCFPRFFY